MVENNIQMDRQTNFKMSHDNKIDNGAIEKTKPS